MTRRSAVWALGTPFALVIALAPAAARAQGHPCVYQGSEYSDGALSCQRGEQVQCMNGEWVDQAETCAGDYGGATGQINMDSGAERPAPTDTFMPGDSQVAPPMPDDQ
jgi:hypothetical protein